MNKLRTLLFLELRALFGINRFLYTKDPRQKKRGWLLTVAIGLLLVMAFGYVGGLVYGLCALGLQSIVPAYLAVLASLLIVVFGIFTAGNRMFGPKGYDLLASMPIPTGTLVLSRFFAMYAEDLLLTLVILLPGFGVYGICCQPGPGFYVAAVFGAVWLPAIPLVFATLFGTVTLAISSRMKNKSLVQSVLTVGFVIAVLVASFGMGESFEAFTPEAFAALAQTVGDLLGKIYPPAQWLNGALTQADVGAMGLFVLASLGALGLAVWVVAGNYHGIRRRLRTTLARKDYQISTMESRGLLKALCIREAKRYFSSSIYVTNTILGPILGAVLSVSICLGGLEAVQEALQLPADLSGLLPFAVASVFCMMTTSCTSISMEGKQFWVIQSLPIPTKTLLDSKMILNLALMLPCFGVSLVALAVGTRPGLLDFLWLVLIPGSMMLFSVVFGITVNLKFHSFDWEREGTVVKQSLPAALGGFAGFLLAVLLGAAALTVPAEWGHWARALMCLVLLGLTAWLYERNNRAVLSEL